MTNSLRRAQAGRFPCLWGELLKVAEVLRVMRGLTQWRKRSEGLETSIDWRFEALTPNKYLEEKSPLLFCPRRKWLTARPRRWETSGGKSTPLHSGFGKAGSYDPFPGLSKISPGAHRHCGAAGSWCR